MANDISILATVTQDTGTAAALTWLLATGFWVDGANWLDSQNWID